LAAPFGWLCRSGGQLVTSGRNRLGNLAAIDADYAAKAQGV
jgi:hypothetical protein